MCDMGLRIWNWLDISYHVSRLIENSGYVANEGWIKCRA